MDNSRKLSSLADVKVELSRLTATNDVKITNWSLYEILRHCAQTIEYSMTGYPAMKPKLLRVTLGRLVIRKFLRQGYMTHNLSAHVPGGESITNEGSTDEGLQRLIRAIDKFEAYTGTLAPHLIFGCLSKDEYDRYFAMHIANHLSEVQYGVLA
jgi:hypothetical protein